MNDYLKYAAGAALFLLWAGLVIFLKLDPTDLIETIKLGVYAILGFVGVTKLQAATPAAPAPDVPSKPSNAAPTVPLQ